MERVVRGLLGGAVIVVRMGVWLGGGGLGGGWLGVRVAFPVAFMQRCGIAVHPSKGCGKLMAWKLMPWMPAMRAVVTTIGLGLGLGVGLGIGLGIGLGGGGLALAGLGIRPANWARGVCRQPRPHAFLVKGVGASQHD